MKVRDIMERRVITVSPKDSIVKVLRIFSKRKISGVPVVEGGKLVGIITDGDIIANLDIYTPKIHFSSSPDFLLILAGLKSRRGMDEIEKEMQVMKKFKVQDFMTKDVITAKPEDSIVKVARIMHKNGIKRVPILSKKGKLVGIVARQDIIRAFSK